MLSGKLKIEKIQSIDAFATLEKEWNELLSKSEESTFFLKWDWIFAWWEHFGSTGDLFVLLIKNSSGELLGLAPFYINKKWQGLPIKALSYIGSEPISSEYLDIICAPEHKESVAVSIVGYLSKQSFLWDCIALNDTLDDSVSYTLLQNKLSDRGFISVNSGRQLCPYLELPSSEQDLLDKLSSSLRSTIKRKTKKMLKDGITFQRTSDVANIDSHMNSLFSLHQKCWNARGKPGTLKDEDKKKFHLSVAANLLPKNNIRLYTLNENDNIIAALYGFQYGGSIFYFQSGYDPEWSEYSPGTLLMWNAMNDAIQEGAQLFDFLRGDESYKKLWADNIRITYRTVFYKKSNIKMNTYFQLTKAISFVKRRVKPIIFKLQSLLKYKV
jgi:CelD/BcsL family acetyltransferase involved in cellulose biosynthesis